MQQLEPPPPPRPAQHQRGGPALPDLRAQALLHRGGGHGGDGAAQLGGQIQHEGEPRAGEIAQPLGARGFDGDGDPWRAQGIGEAACGADQALRSGMVADPHHDPLTRRPNAHLARKRDVLQHLAVDRLRGAAQRQLAQRRKIGLGEEMREGPARLLRHIDLALFQPLDQLVGRQIDHLDLGVIQNGIGHRLAHPHAGKAGDEVVQALDMLDIEGGEHVDAGVAQLLDILPALGMAAARRVGVGQLVYQRHLRVAGQHRVYVEFAEGVGTMLQRAARQDLEGRGQRHGLGAAMGFDDAGHDILAIAQHLRARPQHLEGFAHTRRGTQKDLEAAPRFAPGRLEQSFGRGAVLVDHRAGILPLLALCRLIAA